MAVGLRAGGAYVDILPRVGKDFDAALARDVEGPARKTGSNITKIVGAIGGAVVAKKAFDFLGDAVDAARESNKVGAQTEAVLKSTGSAAGLTAKQIGDYASALSSKTAIDDEAIQSGENLLLTFTNVRDGVGKGNDIFRQTTSIMADMSAALGQDTKSSAIQLGKALNDPIKGVTALQRVGVSFTAAQKEQIKTLVESGRTMDAQKVILKELAGEFGGSAAAIATPSARLKVTLGNLQETIGNKLLPVVDKLSTFLADKLPPALDFVTRNAKPLGIILAAVLVPAFIAWAAAATASAVATLAAALPVIAVVAAVGALAAGLIYAYTHWQVFHDVVDAVVSFVRDHVAPILTGLALVLGGPVAALIVAYTQFQTFRDIVDGVIDAVVAAISGFVTVVVGLWRTFGDSIVTYLQGVWTIISGVVQGAVDVIRGIIDVVLGLITGDWGRAWDGVKGIVEGVWTAIEGIVRGAIGIVEGVLSGFVAGIAAVFHLAWDPVTKIVGDVLSGIVDTVTGMPGRIARAAAGMFDGIKSAFRFALNWVIRAWNHLEFKIPGFDPPGPGPSFGGFVLGVPDIPELHQGGKVLSGGLVNMRPGEELVNLPGGASVSPLERAGVTIVVEGSLIHERNLIDLLGDGLRERLGLAGVRL